ncbi:LysR family transcriptional regulator [Rhodococcus qingshengii]|uniref:LysR family transcriptional regulator n=1 Tax=Rhodococcus qingshengii TaxID=334542 RepID=UPI0035F6EFDB
MRPYEQPFLWSLDWNLLRTFTVVVEQGGITRAADFLDLSQPTVSSALKRLEQAVGHQLLDRRPGHFSLSTAGAALYRESSAMLDSVSRIPSLMVASEKSVSGHVSLAAASHVVSPHFDEVLRQFNATHPDVTYSTVVTDSADVLSRVRQNRASFGICLMRDEDVAVESHVLYCEYFGLYCGPGHELFGRTRIALPELAGRTAVSFQTELENGPLFRVRQLRERFKLDPKPRGVSANLLEVRRMIIAGLGIGALPVHTARADVESGLLWPLLPTSELLSTEVHLVINPRRSFDAAEAAFLGRVRSMLDAVPIAQRTYR